MGQGYESIVRKCGRLGIRRTLGLALGLAVSSSALGVTGLFAYQIRQAGRGAERLRVVAMAETYAAEAGGILAGQRPGRKLEEEVQGWTWHPDSRFLGVLDLDGNPLAVRGDRRMLLGVLERVDRSEEALAGTQCFLPGEWTAFGSEAAVAAVPLRLPGWDRPAGTLIYAAAGALPASGFVEGMGRHVGAVLTLAGAGLVMALLLLRHSLLEPLNLLLQQGREARSEERPAERTEDELGALAGLLGELSRDQAHWRERVARLEESLEQRVRDETKKVALKLRQVERKAWMDPMTRLGNRRLLEEKFAALFARQRDAGEELSVVMIDVDHFKTLNDTLGHKAGDELVAFIGDLLRQCVREGDLAIRYGGDEFLLILPGTSSAEAGAAAERVLRLFGQRARLLQVEPKPSMSAGVVSLREHRPRTATAMMQMADQALYRAKHLGKSQVCVYQFGYPLGKPARARLR